MIHLGGGRTAGEGDIVAVVPEEDESGVLQLVEWREEAPYG